MPPAVEARSLNHWTAGKSFSLFFIGNTEEQRSSVAFTGPSSQYVTVYTELRSSHRNQGYRLFHNLFLPRTHVHTHARTHTHTHTHRGFFIMPSFPFSHICLSLTPYLTLRAWAPWAHQHILLDLQRGTLYVFILKSCYEEMNIIPVLSCMFPIFPSHHPQTPQTLQTSPRSWPEWVPH